MYVYTYIHVYISYAEYVHKQFKGATLFIFTGTKKCELNKYFSLIEVKLSTEIMHPIYTEYIEL